MENHVKFLHTSIFFFSILKIRCVPTPLPSLRAQPAISPYHFMGFRVKHGMTIENFRTRLLKIKYKIE